MTKPDQPFGTVYDYRHGRYKSTHPGRIKGNRMIVTTYFDIPLITAIRDEASSRGWSLSRMIRHLCEASIEGIE